MLALYRTFLNHGESRLRAFLQKRLLRGKEDAERIGEREGIASLPRPEGRLVWVHGASVGEAQSALILIKRLIENAKGDDFHVMVTTGTLSSSKFLKDRLPKGAFHQFYPLDHPDWVIKFLDHWKPDAVLWMESELWPNMLQAIEERQIPAVMVNARLSDRSYKLWKWIKGDIKTLLGCFDLILTQSEEAKERFGSLGGLDVRHTGNIKYSAAPLPCDDQALSAFRVAVGQRPVWVYASSHQGEEQVACDVHQILKTALPDVLTVIIPRHPERGDMIEALVQKQGLRYSRRSKNQALPLEEDDIYIADTMGELGLFYRAAALSCIGRSLSDDGGGGHNPVEAAQLYCGVLHGPHIQYQRDFYADMNGAGAAIQIDDGAHLAQTLQKFLSNPDALQKFRDTAYQFTRKNGGVIDRVMKELSPFLQDVMIQR